MHLGRFFARKRPLPKPSLKANKFPLSEVDPELRLESYYDLFFPDYPFHGLRNSTSKSMKHLLQTGRLSQGQWLFLVLEYFRAEMLNGGIRQFFGNGIDMAEDTIEALEVIGLRDFASDMKDANQTLGSVYAESMNWEGDARQLAVRRKLREMEARAKEIDESDPACLKIGEGFVLCRDETTRKMYWKDDQYAPRLLTALLSYIESNPTDFVTFEDLH